MSGRKIRGFKLNLRVKELQRRAKKAKVDLSAVGPDAEAALVDLVKRSAAAMSPSALYGSFPAQDANLAPVPGLAYGLGLSTLGPDLDGFIEQAALENSPRGQALDIVARLALEESTAFILGLMEEEARGEHCELSPIQYLTDPSSVRDAAERLEGHKIGVAVAEDGTFRPLRTVAFSVSWLARSKRAASSRSRA